VRLVVRFDTRKTMRFAALQGETAARHLARRPELEAVDSIVLIEGETARVRSDAVLAVIRYLGWPWKLLLVGRLIPRAVRDWCYDAVAARRKRVFGAYDACPVPPPDVRSRFLP